MVNELLELIIIRKCENYAKANTHMMRKKIADARQMFKINYINKNIFLFT